MYLGKRIRLERIINREDGRTIIVPMDHGVTVGAVEGLIDMRETVNDMATGGADAVLIGRPFVPMVYGDGAQGVATYIEKIGSELRDTMAMCGVHTLDEITRDCVRVM